MKKTVKLVSVAVLLILFTLILAGCSEINTGNRIMSGRDVQTFTYAYIQLGPDRIKEGYVTQWRDYENSDTVQVLVDGKYYLTHYTNVILIADPSQGALQYTDPEYFTNE